MKEIDMSKFCVFILAHGRPNITDTYDHLLGGGYTGKIIFLVDNEDDKVSGYYEKYGDENVYMFDKIAAAKECDPMNNFGGRRATLFARNKAFDVAKELGYDYFLVLDDDYYYFGHRGEYGAKKTTKLDLVFKYFVEFLANTPTKAIAFSQGGDHIGGYRGDEIPMKRKCMNSFFCVTERPFKFYGSMNDDANMYIQNGIRGDIFLTFYPFMLHQPPTQNVDGGLSDLYKKYGTYVKSFYSVMLSPSSVVIKLMGHTSPRLHHKIDYKKTMPCIIDEKYKKI